MVTIYEDLSLEDLIYAFDAETRGMSVPQAPPQTVFMQDPSHGKHLALLDGLALLLVAPAPPRTGAKPQGSAALNDDKRSGVTDVAAVTMDVQSSPARSKRTTTTFWYTKHEASSTEQEGFIRAVVDIAQHANDGEDLKAQYAALSELVDHHCKAKIASRFTRVIDSVGNIGFPGLLAAQDMGR